MRKEILIMTKSAKRKGFCVAGIDVNNGQWIRLVSDDESNEGAVSREDLFFKDGTQADICYIVGVECEPVPTKAQSENYLYKSGHKWEKVGVITLEEAFSKCKLSDSKYIFVNHNRSLNENELTGESLLFAEIDHIDIKVVNEYDMKKWKADFDYNGFRYYNINIGDIEIRNAFSFYGTNRIEGKHYAVFSLTGKYEITGKYYKMLATLF